MPVEAARRLQEAWDRKDPKLLELLEEFGPLDIRSSIPKNLVAEESENEANSMRIIKEAASYHLQKRADAAAEQYKELSRQVSQLLNEGKNLEAAELRTQASRLKQEIVDLLHQKEQNETT